jgi:hypothetical protein
VIPGTRVIPGTVTDSQEEEDSEAGYVEGY